MQWRRFFCFLLVFVCILPAAFSLSASAIDINGYSVYTTVLRDDGNVTGFESTVIYDYYPDSLTIYADVFLPSPFDRNSVFNFTLNFNSFPYDSIEAVCYFYNSNGKQLGSQNAIIDEGTLYLDNVLVNGGNLARIRVEFSIIEPFFEEVVHYEEYEFIVNGTSYICYEGMDWATFIESSFNDGTFSLDNGFVKSSISNDFVYDNGVKVSSSDLIIDGQSYWLTTDNSIFEQEIQFRYYYNDYGNYYWFTYLKGMTWLEFINSDYNKHSLSTSIRFDVFNSTYVTYGNGSSTVCYGAGSPVSVNDEIKYSIYGTQSWLQSNPQPLVDYEYTFDFSVTGVEATLSEGDSLLGGILGWIKNIFNTIVNLPGNIANAIRGFFDSVVNSVRELGQNLLEGIKNLFVPSEESMIENQTKWEQLLSSRFGAVYQSASLIDDFASSFIFTETQTEIFIPLISVELVGVPFEFGGWTVDIIPDGFEGIIVALKMIVNVCCTFLFINGMKKRLEEVLG